MREIKFRYTIIRANGYNFTRFFTLQEIEAGLVKTFFEANYVGVGDKVFRDQFTGLKDKNGKEIYKGDIIRVGNFSDPRNVYWDDLKAAFYITRLKSGIGLRPLCGLACYLHNIVEIIGNIHENSELLKD